MFISIHVPIIFLLGLKLFADFIEVPSKESLEKLTELFDCIDKKCKCYNYNNSYS